jgi:hypothetical protein
MSHRATILELIRREPGLTDTEIRLRTGIEPHQQVNQICNQLQRQGLICRVPGPQGVLMNVPVGSSGLSSGERNSPEATSPKPGAPLSTASLSALRDQDQPSRSGNYDVSQLDPSRAMIILACSGAKRAGDGPRDGACITHHLSPETAARLIMARREVAVEAGVDESTLKPAWLRYSGGFYSVASSALYEATAAQGHVVILSGGYGIVLSSDPIGMYEAVFHASWWPHGLIERCLVEYAQRHGLATAVAFLAATTEYAKVVRKVPWSETPMSQVHLVTPVLATAGGAQRVVPRAAGEAFEAFCRRGLGPDWASTDGLGLAVERVL